MVISTYDQIVKGLASGADRVVLDKASLGNAVAGQYFSLWTAAGSPGAGSAPSTTPALANAATVGAMGLTNQTGNAADGTALTSYLGHIAFASGNGPSNLEIHDRLAHVGGLSGVVTTAQGSLDLQALAPPAARLGSADYSDVQWWLEVYTAMGSTGVNATVAVTLNDGTTSSVVIALGATPRQGRLYQISQPVAGKYIRDVDSVTLSATTGTAGNFGIIATRPRTALGVPVANYNPEKDWAALGLPEIPNDSCLMMLLLCTTTTTGAVRGMGKIIHG